jgi:CheY-like chemotaxis protein
MLTNRLLLVEDDYDVAEMLVMYFGGLGYEVLHADSGSLGIDLARTRFPGVILLDVMLPDMDGYETCYQLRQMSLTKYIPTIFLTQKDERAARVRGLEIGADDYITKPFDIDELRLRIEGSIRRATRENLHEARTGLPTGQLAIEELVRLRDNGAHILRFTLAGYDAYADVYSFMAASDVMFHAGKTIRAALGARSARDFVGILGDDFVVATHAEDLATLCDDIQRGFARQARAFYTFADAERGGLLLDAGTDHERFVPIMSFTIHEDAV